jgi:hypothetical protein
MVLMATTAETLLLALGQLLTAANLASADTTPQAKGLMLVAALVMALTT